ncbi:MAG: Smr/MutS family protein [Rhodothermaceae bacterium]|nr:Smr/MutS family protein [Rhodothermaceae bacterium]MXX57707.1 Smr/MutS family protein [Rhodothermaceae bacterium]MYD18117.1 Smr/MutS family protein [Rhodothermaceae bacterium]MYD55691.1 Smr/MutS family protein [Rhodothermaceae bacterium]MYI44047.1 Smr/MutS family protein [Rhodothermaceae bacterium]
MPDNPDQQTEDLIRYPIDGVLDLHTFHPRDAAEVTREYLRECHREGTYCVRIIHGKGKGVLRGIVHAVLSDCSFVDSWGTAPDSSGWGATVVNLKRKDSSD